MVLGHFIDPAFSSEIGWRSWFWRSDLKLLQSPLQGTVWYDRELKVEQWDETNAVRGVAGIHAHRVPIYWENINSEYSGMYAEINFGPKEEIRFIARTHRDVFYYPCKAACIITGLIERFGKFVLGTEGWRAEWVLIKKLKAPTQEIGLELEKAYPDVEVIYPKEN